MNKQKRMVYIYEENVDFYDSLENKSQFINDALQAGKTGSPVKAQEIKPGEALDTEYDPDWHPDPRIRETRKQIREMEERDRKALGR